MKLKKFLTTFLSVAMIVPAIPTVSQAELVTGASKAKVDMVLMVPDDSVAIKYKEINADELQVAENGKFYVGIKLTDFKNIKEAAEFVDMSKGGLNDIAFGIAYNTDYVTLEPDIARRGGKVNANLVGTAWTNRMQFDNSILKKSGFFSYSYDTGMIEETTSTTTGYNTDLNISVPCGSASQGERSDYSGADDVYFAIVCFGFTKAAETATSGTKIVGFSDNARFTSMSFGLAGIDKVTYQLSGAITGSTQGIKNVVDFSDIALDIFPAGAVTKTGVQVKTGKSMTTPQNEGAAFSFNKADLEFITDAPGTADLTADDTVAYYYGDTGVTSTDGTGLTAMPAKLTSDVNGKTVYAIVTAKNGSKFIVSLGALTVTPKTVSSIIKVNNTPSGVAKDSAVDFLAVTLTIKNNLNEEETLTFTKDANGNYKSNKYDFYIYKGTETNVGDKVVNPTDVYADGTNSFVVSNGTLKKGFEVATDKVETIVSVSGTPENVFAGSSIDFAGTKASITTTKNTTAFDVTFVKNSDGNFTTDNGLFIYKKDASGNLTKVSADDTFAEGDNNFVVAPDGATTVASATVKYEFTITAAADTPVITATVSTQKYKGTATLDKSMITLNKKRPSEPAPTTITFADMLADTATYKVVLAADATAAEGADAITIGSEDVTVTDAHYGWGVFVITGGQTYKVAELKKKSSGGGGGGGSTTSYLVTFKAGANGELASGESKTQSVDKNATVKSTPAVVAKDGYKFIGWSLDGKTVVDATSQAITKATTFTAVYEKVEEPTETPAPTVEPTTAPIIDANYTKPYASGYDDGSFAPNNNITRGELAAMIARLSYGDDLPDGMYEASFPDVDDDAWFNKYIGYLEDKDVLSGYEDGTFRPMNTITRGEISAVIARAQKYDLLTYTGSFADVDDSDWAKDYIETLASKNIVTGYEDGTFGPYSPLTRAEAVAIINRVLADSEPVVTFTPNDIAGHWAEADILLAVNERMLAGMGAPVAEPEEIVEEVVEEDKAEVEEVEEEAEEAETEADETEEVAE